MGRLRREGSTCARREGRAGAALPARREEGHAHGRVRETWETGPTLEFERCLPYLSGLSGRQHVFWVTVRVQNGPRGTRLTALLRGRRRKTRGVAAFPSLLRCPPPPAPNSSSPPSPEGRVQAFPEDHLDREGDRVPAAPPLFVLCRPKRVQLLPSAAVLPFSQVTAGTTSGV